mmetsp:Transcript_101471/g.217276  ORF Transcript_101471/g.217276 Transcript_101471/m.217276 type:complete len:386 (-) Transcript_101471:50-1207(-)
MASPKAATAEDWFNSTVTPDAAVSTYAGAWPKGMTNPPQNPKVRKMLLEDLQRYQVQLSHPSWPPQQRPVQEEVRRVPELSRSMGDLMQSYSSLISDGTYRLRRPWNQKGGRTSSPLKSTMRNAKRIYSGGYEEDLSQSSLSRSLDTSRMSVGYTTGMWRHKAPGAGDSVGSASASASPASSKKGAGDASKKKEQRKAMMVAPGKEKPDRIMSDIELRNAREGLRAQSSLHNSSVQDRYRFASDVSPGANLVIAGAGTGWGNAAPNWASDASYLNQFHHGAIRIVNPSGLDTLPEEPKSRRKKKKDEDDLQLSDSGLFQPRYPLDNSLRSLKMLKKKTFPEACRTEEEVAAMAAAQAAAEQASSFASQFNLKGPSPEEAFAMGAE